MLITVLCVFIFIALSGTCGLIIFSITFEFNPHNHGLKIDVLLFGRCWSIKAQLNKKLSASSNSYLFDCTAAEDPLLQLPAARLNAAQHHSTHFLGVLTTMDMATGARHQGLQCSWTLQHLHVNM